MQRKGSYAANKQKVYALLCGQCAKALQAKLQARVDFDTNIKNDPIALLKAIEGHSVSYQERQYPYRVIQDALKNFVHIRQKEDEDLIDFTTRFKSARDIYTTQAGCYLQFETLIKERVAAATSGSDKEKRDKATKEVFAEYCAFLYIEAVDRSKYGTLVEGLNTQYSLNNDQCPKTILDATNILSNHKFDDACKEKKQKKKQEQKSKEQEKDNNNETVNPLDMTFAQIKGKYCYCCGSNDGHVAKNCSKAATLPKKDWFVNKCKDMQHIQAAVGFAQVQAPAPAPATAPTTTPSNDPPKDDEDKFSWEEDDKEEGTGHAQVQCSQQGVDYLHNEYLMDSCSTVDHFRNHQGLTNIRIAKKPLRLATNGGIATTPFQAELPGYGTLWFDHKAMTNIFGLASMNKKHRVTYDSAVEKAFVVHLPGKKVKFVEGPDGLYALESSASISDFSAGVGKPTASPASTTNTPAAMLAGVETVEGNIKKLGVTDREIKQASLARQVLHNLGFPSIKAFRKGVSDNQFENCPITLQDISMADKLWGKDVPSLKGKSARVRPHPVQPDDMEIPPQLQEANRELSLCIDIMCVNEIPFLTSVTKRLIYRMADYVTGTSRKPVKEAIVRALLFCLKHDFTIREVCSDRAFIKTLESLRPNHGFTTNFASA